MARRAFLCLVVVSVAVLAPRILYIERALAVEQPFQQVYSQLDVLFRRYYPHVKAEASSDRIHFEHNTRIFLIHEPLRTGEWQDAREVRGPNRGGILCDIELRKGKYLGAAAVPQTFDKRYFRLSVAAPYSVSRDEHLYVRLSYPADAKVEFLEQFSTVVNGFASLPCCRV